MASRRSHLVVIPRSDGGAEVHAMKEWLRQHPDQLPAGFHPETHTSHQLRAALQRGGWKATETDNEFRLSPPGTTLTGTVLEADGASTDPADPEDQTYFGLESQLRDFLAQNISAVSIAGKRLKVYIDPTGEDGIEYRTGVGFIDILAVDDTGSFFVFELKRGRTPDHTIGQIARYMGWVQQTIGRGKQVYGVIVAKQISETLRYAASVMPNLSLFEYEVSFQLKPASHC